MPQIRANVWLDSAAEEAAGLYVATLPETRVTATTRYLDAGQEIHGQMPDSVMTIDLDVAGFGLTLLNGGPGFKPNPAISFFCSFAKAADIDRAWAAFANGGTVHMELDSYPWSERYGWVSDRFGVSWQLVLDAGAKLRVFPSLLFVGGRCGHAEQAMRFYASVFRDAEVGEIARYGANQAPDREGTVMYGELRLEGQRFAVMDSAGDHGFDFTEGVSLIVDAMTQEQIDHYWSRLSAVPEVEQCGWLKDRYGVSWQVYPVAEMNRALSLTDRAAANRTMEAILAMKKIDLAGLRAAVQGR